MGGDVIKKTVTSKTAPKKKSRKSAKVRLPKGPIWQWSALETAAAIRSGAISWSRSQTFISSVCTQLIQSSTPPGASQIRASD
jgi:hypothetical protein